MRKHINKFSKIPLALAAGLLVQLSSASLMAGEYLHHQGWRIAASDRLP